MATATFMTSTLHLSSSRFSENVRRYVLVIMKMAIAVDRPNEGQKESEGSSMS